MPAYLFECFGTFFLVLTIALTGEPIAIGMVLTALLYAGGSVSGAHYNPAVTFALYLRKKIKKEEVARYVVAQLIGAILASTVAELFGKPLMVQPGIGVSWITALLAEVLFTGLLATVVLHVAASKKTQGNHYFGLAIGATVIAGALSVGSISGGAFNPAVGVGPLIEAFLMRGIMGNPSLFFLYTVGPLLGAFAAAKLHELTSNE